MILRLQLDLILIRARDGELRRTSIGIGSADRIIRLRSIGRGLHILDELPKRRGIIDPVHNSLSTDEAKSLWIDAKLLPHSIKLLKSLRRPSCARGAGRRCSRSRARGGGRDG